MYKIVFFDLDGTLLTDEKTVLEENKREIKRVNKLGVETVICTGRQANAVQCYKEMAGTGRFVICTNGAEIYDYREEKVIYKSVIKKQTVLELCNIAEKTNYLLKIDTLNARYINNMEYSQVGEIEINQTIKELLDDNEILQVSIGSTNRKELDNLVHQIQRLSDVKVENYFYFKNNMWILNIVNKEVSKGNAVKLLCDYLSITSNNAIAFGDDINDISMLTSVGYGIAMENAIDKLKNIARKIIGNNNEESIAKELINMFYNKK